VLCQLVVTQVVLIKRGVGLIVAY